MSCSIHKGREILKQVLLRAAKKMKKNMGVIEYKSIVIGLVFLKYISDLFDEFHARLVAGDEDRAVYQEANVFYVPPKARWSYLKDQGASPGIGQVIDEAMAVIEKENTSLSGILPDGIYANSSLDEKSLEETIGLISLIDLGDKVSRDNDILGRTYEFFLGQFASSGGEFYTPRCIVELIVEMIQPFSGCIYDPCCGSGGMFVMGRYGRGNNVSIYGQESNQTTYRLCRMNLAIRGIDGTNVRWNAEGSFLNDAHPDLKADFILANPPFNDSDWSGEMLTDDPRWRFGIPTPKNANYAWIQHMIYHLSPQGVIGLVLANGSLSSSNSGERDIRQHLIEADLVECIVTLPKQLFYNTGIPVCLWILNNHKNRSHYRKRTGDILFIDASNMGFVVDRTHRGLTKEDIAAIATVFHAWRDPGGDYRDVKGFCKAAGAEEVRKHKFVLTPGRYVGIPDEEDDGVSFEEKMTGLTSELAGQMHEARVLDGKISEVLRGIGWEV
jgi:type I restriction enzyme M protein